MPDLENIVGVVVYSIQSVKAFAELANLYKVSHDLGGNQGCGVGVGVGVVESDFNVFRGIGVLKLKKPGVGVGNLNFDSDSDSNYIM